MPIDYGCSGGACELSLARARVSCVEKGSGLPWGSTFGCDANLGPQDGMGVPEASHGVRGSSLRCPRPIDRQWAQVVAEPDSAAGSSLQPSTTVAFVRLRGGALDIGSIIPAPSGDGAELTSWRPALRFRGVRLRLRPASPRRKSQPSYQACVSEKGRRGRERRRVPDDARGVSPGSGPGRQIPCLSSLCSIGGVSTLLKQDRRGRQRRWPLAHLPEPGGQPGALR